MKITYLLALSFSLAFSGAALAADCNASEVVKKQFRLMNEKTKSQISNLSLGTEWISPGVSKVWYSLISVGTIGGHGTGPITYPLTQIGNYLVDTEKCEMLKTSAGTFQHDGVMLNEHPYFP